MSLKELLVLIINHEPFVFQSVMTEIGIDWVDPGIGHTMDEPLVTIHFCFDF